MGRWLLLRDCYVIGLPDELSKLRTHEPAAEYRDRDQNGSKYIVLHRAPQWLIKS
jgi:hypothetical protein